MKIILPLVLLSILLYSGCNKPSPGFDFELFKNTAGENLSNAVKSQSTQAIIRILETTNISPDFREPTYGHTLLMLAVANNLQKSVKSLLGNGADPNLRSYDNVGQKKTPMFIACNHRYKKNVCNLDVLKSLISFGGNVNDSLEIQFLNADYISYDTPLIEACKSGCLEMVKLLIDNGSKFNDYDYSEGVGPISYLIIFDHLEILDYLISEKKIKIPLFCCVIHAYKETARIEMTIEEALMRKKYDKYSENYQLRNQIIENLHALGY